MSMRKEVVYRRLSWCDHYSQMIFYTMTRDKLAVKSVTKKGGSFSDSSLLTLGARDFSSAVSGFCQVFIVTRAKSGFFSRLRPTAEDVSAFASTENSRRAREKPLVPRV